MPISDALLLVQIIANTKNVFGVSQEAFGVSADKSVVK